MSPEALSEDESKRRDRELDIKEREVAVKEVEAKTARAVKLSVVVGAFLTALSTIIGFAVNIYIAQKNNENSQKIEIIRNQSSLILEAVRTNGNYVAACKNLLFFVNVGLLNDPNKTIRSSCPLPPSAQKGPPSLPAHPIATTPAPTTGFGSGGFGEGGFGGAVLTPSLDQVVESRIFNVLDEDGQMVNFATVEAPKYNQNCMTGLGLSTCTMYLFLPRKDKTTEVEVVVKAEGFETKTMNIPFSENAALPVNVILKRARP